MQNTKNQSLVKRLQLEPEEATILHNFWVQDSWNQNLIFLTYEVIAYTLEPLREITLDIKPESALFRDFLAKVSNQTGRAFKAERMRLLGEHDTFVTEEYVQDMLKVIHRTKNLLRGIIRRSQTYPALGKAARGGFEKLMLYEVNVKKQPVRPAQPVPTGLSWVPNLKG